MRIVTQQSNQNDSPVYLVHIYHYLLIWNLIHKKIMDNDDQQSQPRNDAADTQEYSAANTS